MNEREFKDGKLIADITEICNVWNTAETNARLRKFITDFRAAVLKEAAERAVEWFDNAMGYDVVMCDTRSLRVAILDDHVHAATKMTDPLTVDVLLDANQDKLHVDLHGRRAVRACPTCAESVDGAPGAACCGQCIDER